MPSGCGIGGDAFWLTWDAATGRQAALNGSGRAGSHADAGWLRADRADRAPAPRAADDHRPGRGPVVGRRACAGSGGCRATRSWPRPSSWHGTGSRRGTGSSMRSSVTAPIVAERPRTGRRVLRGLPAARPAVASGRDACACPPWRRPSRRWRATGSTPSTTATSATARRAALADVGALITRGDLRAHTSTPDRADRHRLPRRPGHDPPAEQLRHRRARAAVDPRAVRGARPRRVRARPASTDPGWIHLGIEAAKLAMADRDAYLTDPAFATVPVEHLLDPGYAAELAARIDPRRARHPGSLDQPGRRRHDLPRHRRRRGQRGQPHRVELPRVRVGRRRPGHRHPLPEPRQLLQPRRGRTRTVLAPGKRTLHTLLPGMLFRDGQPGPWVVAGLDGRRRPAADPRPARLGRWSMAGSTSGRRSRAPRWYVEPADHFAPPLDVLLEPRHAPGVAEALECDGSHLVRDRGVRLAALATSTPSSWSTAARGRPTARWPRRRTRAARVSRRSGRTTSGDAVALPSARPRPESAAAGYTRARRWQAALTRSRHRPDVRSAPLREGT